MHATCKFCDWRSTNDENWDLDLPTGAWKDRLTTLLIEHVKAEHPDRAWEGEYGTVAIFIVGPDFKDLPQ